jgi:hypothetical protein
MPLLEDTDPDVVPDYQLHGDPSDIWLGFFEMLNVEVLKYA